MVPKLTLERFAYLPKRALGKLILHEQSRPTPDDLTFYTIERPWLDNRPNVSCIPDGTYTMRRFFDVQGYRSSKRIDTEFVWEICDVPGRTVILVHVANYEHNVKGCVGLGTNQLDGFAGVSSSRTAIKRFYQATQGYDEMEVTVQSRAAA